MGSRGLDLAAVATRIARSENAFDVRGFCLVHLDSLTAVTCVCCTEDSASHFLHFHEGTGFSVGFDATYIHRSGGCEDEPLNSSPPQYLHRQWTQRLRRLGRILPAALTKSRRCDGS